MQFSKSGHLLIAAAVLAIAAPACADDINASTDHPAAPAGPRASAPGKPPMEITVPTPLPHVDPLAAKRAGTADTAALLADQPGVSLYTGGGVSSLPAIHGLNDDRVKLLVDGMLITSACANHMNPALSYVSPSGVQAVGVSSGLTPVSMGGDSIAGTITVSTPGPVFAEPGKTRTAGSVSAFYRSVNNGSSLSATAAVASDSVSVAYSAMQDQADSYKDGHGKLVRDTLYKSLNQQLAVATRRGDDLLVVKAGVQSIPYEGFVNQYMDMVGNRGTSLDADYRAHFAWGVLDTRVYWQDTRHEMGFFTPEKTGSMPMNTHGKNVGYALKAEVPLSKRNTLRIGNEFHGFRLDDWWPPLAGSMMMSPNPYLSINNGRRDVYSLYGEMESKWDAQWGSVIGVRAEQVRMDTGAVQSYGCGMMCAADTTAATAFNAANRARTDNNLDLSAVARYAADQTSSYTFGYARKVRSPNLYERYAWGRSQMAMNMIGWFGDANGYVGNLDLKPEIANTLSATGKWGNADIRQLALTGYYTRVQNYVGVNQLGTYVSGGSTFARLQFANQDVRLYGVDMSGKAALWDTGHSAGRFKAVAGWMRGMRMDTGASLYHIMPFHAQATLQQTVSAWSNALEVQFAAGKYNVDMTRFEPETPAYTLVNLRTAYERNGVRFDFGVDNLFNKFYSLPLGGVDYADWKADGKTGQIAPVAGMGRSINAGLTVKL
jgi:iron complex outermembrane receptor protein